MRIPSFASIEEFAQGFKDTGDNDDIFQVDNISLYGSESEEGQQSIDPHKGQIPVPVIEPISSLSCPIQLPNLVTEEAAAKAASLLPSIGA